MHIGEHGHGLAGGGNMPRVRTQHRIVVSVGQPHHNGCRRTKADVTREAGTTIHSIEQDLLQQRDPDPGTAGRSHGFACHSRSSTRQHLGSGWRRPAAALTAAPSVAFHTVRMPAQPEIRRFVLV